MPSLPWNHQGKIKGDYVAKVWGDFPYETYSAEASKLFHERYDGGRLPKKTGIEKILQALSQKGKKIALASSTRRQTVESQLREAD